jgi:vacuolar-type H+-ATPase subunit E/Vma4
MKRLLSQIWPWSKIERLEGETNYLKVNHEKEMKLATKPIINNFNEVARGSELKERVMSAVEDKCLEELTPILSDNAFEALRAAFKNNPKRHNDVLLVAYNKNQMHYRYELIIPAISYSFYILDDNS